MKVWILFNATLDDTESLVDIYKTKALAKKAMRLLQGEQGDSYFWQYLTIKQKTVKEKVRI